MVPLYRLVQLHQLFQLPLADLQFPAVPEILDYHQVQVLPGILVALGHLEHLSARLLMVQLDQRVLLVLEHHWIQCHPFHQQHRVGQCIL